MRRAGDERAELAVEDLTGNEFEFHRKSAAGAGITAAAPCAVLG
jgi:hypothetical protein